MPENLSGLLNWALSQDPLLAVVLFLLIRSEVRTGQTVAALRLTNGLSAGKDAISKEVLTK